MPDEASRRLVKLPLDPGADPSKLDVRIYDYVDSDVPMLQRMFERRLRGYRAIGYARGEAPLGYAEPAYENASESDDDDFAEAGGEDEVE